MNRFLKSIIIMLGLLQYHVASADNAGASARWAGKKILVVMTNHSKYPTRTDATGLWLTELTDFYDVAKAAGIEMDFASPAGGLVPIDERSQGWLYMNTSAKAHIQDQAFVSRLKNTSAVGSLNPNDYAAIYYTGGHGTMWDFRDNEALKSMAESIYRNGGFIASVCHGAAGLLNLKDGNGKPLIANRTVTGFSNAEELLSGTKDQVPFFLQDELTALGATYDKAFIPFASHVVVDGKIVTGQNPNSSEAVAEALVALLKQ
ncbi:type 1 glutamine amidotransferase domain-containing protein [Pseudomonas chlororaphis]|nr:type 1 glutamine amidotransferase domain-containing protein [Pseudomonas chlororaphis]